MGLADLAASAFDQARATLGAERMLSLDGGPLVDVIEEAAERTRDYDELTHAAVERMTVVAPAARMRALYPADPASYEGSEADLGSEEWRVETVADGRAYWRLELVSREEAG